MRVEIKRQTKANGVTVVPGDVVEVDKNEGSVLVNIGKAVLSTKAPRLVDTPLRRKAAAERAAADAAAEAAAQAAADAEKRAQAARAQAEADAASGATQRVKDHQKGGKAK